MNSDDFPTTPDAPWPACIPHFPDGCRTNAFVSRIHPVNAGSADLVYSTLLPGDPSDSITAKGVAVGEDGTIYVAGQLASRPPTLPHRRLRAYLLRLPATGSPGISLFGSQGVNEANDVALDAFGRIYTVGITGTPGLATPNAVGTSEFIAHSAFLSRSGTDISTPDYFAYLGAGTARRISLHPDGAGAVIGTVDPSASLPGVPRAGEVEPAVFASGGGSAGDLFLFVFRDSALPARLSLEKYGLPVGTSWGDTVRYLLLVTADDATARDLVVTDELPDGLELVSYPAWCDGDPDAGVVSCPIASLPPGPGVFIEIEAVVTETGIVCNEASARASNAEEVSDHECIHAALPIPTLGLQKTGSVLVGRNDPVEYRVVVRNGETPAPDTSLRDTLDPLKQIRLDSLEVSPPDAADCSLDPTRGFDCWIDDLEPYEGVVVTARGVAVGSGVVTNRAVVGTGSQAVSQSVQTTIASDSADVSVLVDELPSQGDGWTEYLVVVVAQYQPPVDGVPWVDLVVEFQASGTLGAEGSDQAPIAVVALGDGSCAFPPQLIGDPQAPSPSGPVPGLLVATCTLSNVAQESRVSIRIPDTVSVEDVSARVVAPVIDPNAWNDVWPPEN